MKTFVCFSVIVFSLFIAGCASVEYLDRPTPPGNPIPPPLSAQTPMVQEIPRTTTPVTVQPGAYLASQRTPDGILISASEQKKGMVAAPIPVDLSCFKKLYLSQNKPRIAIFLNRSLSAEIRQWETTQKMVGAGDGELTMGQISAVSDGSYSAGEHSVATRKVFLRKRTQSLDGQTDVRGIGVQAKGNQAVYEQRYVEEEDSFALNGKALWSFENSFFQPFLKNGVKLVDRSTIMRLTAVDQPGADNSNILASPKAVEIKSLVRYADIYTELLVEDNPGEEFGYIFKAVAKEVKTGQVLANVNTVDWDWEEFQQQSEDVVANANGYEFVSKKNSVELSKVAEKLAHELMQNLCYQWQ